MDMQIVVASSSAKRAHKRYPKKAKRVALEVSLSTTNRGPNMSRKSAGAMIYSFPSFDKCDSLLFFPATFTKCLNSGDLPSLSKLILSRIDQRCDVSLANINVSVPNMVTMFGIMNEVHPDSVMCVVGTKVVENQIRAKICYKYTDNKTLRESMEKSFPDPIVYKACSGPRTDPDQLMQFVQSKPANERAEIAYTLQHAEEVVIYGNSYMTLTFDNYTKKVTGLQLECEFTSFTAV
jgi:hypothetical protein